jgi:N-methylhydantoinase A
MGAAFTGKMSGYGNMISLDIGGTSTDVSLIKDGVPSYATDSDIDGYPLRIQVIDINTVGAGGGSIAWIDSGGALKSGPHSSGADPGPACYDRGGEEPTNTDANLLLGYLGEEAFLGGEMKIRKDLARAAIEEKIAKPLKMDLASASHGIFEIACSNMIGAIRKVSVLRGYDPRNYWLFAFGGSGPVYAAKLASEIKMKGVIVPTHPGVQSGFGILTVDYKYDLVRTLKLSLTGENLQKVEDIFKQLEKDSKDVISKEGLKGEVFLQRSADMRYVGQAYELNVPVNANLSGNSAADRVLSDFHGIHNEVYKHCDVEAPVEFVNYRVAASVFSEKPHIEKAEALSKTRNPQKAIIGSREAFFKESGGFFETPVYRRELLEAGNVMEGPAIFEELDSTTVVFPGQLAAVDSYYNIIITFSD